MPSGGNKRYLVTGGAGFLGSNLVRALVERGDTVRVLDNNFRGSAAKLGERTLERIELIEGDVRDRERVFEAVDGVDVVCHLAAINGTRHFYEIPDVVLDVGLRGTLNTLEACVDLGVQEYVFASSSEVYQTPPHVPTPEDVPCSIPDTLNPRYSYGGSKLVGELLAFNYGRGRLERAVVVRPHNVYGPDMGLEHVIPELVVRLRRAARASDARPIELPIQGDGDATRAFCHVGDFVRGLLLVLDAGEDRNVYNIGTEEETAIGELAESIARKMGLEIRLRPSPGPPGGAPRRCPDVGKLRALGYAPRIPLEQGLDDVIRWYGAWADEQPLPGVVEN